jgi:hypothetical protein
VERPAGGRRHTRGGSVSVADLIRRQPGSVRIPTPEQAASDALLSDLLGGRALTDDSDPRTSTTMKVLGVLVGALTLAGTVAAASMITTDHWTPRPAALVATAQTKPLSGAGALRPDLLAREVDGTAKVAAAPLNAAPATSTPTVTTTSPVPRASYSPAARQEQVLAVAAQSPVDVVRSFYDMLASDPRAALSFVGTSLAGLDPVSFVRSWSTVRTLEPERIEALDADSVLGEIAIQQADGSWLHVEQLLRLDGGSQPKIVDAKVLSAQKG